MRRCERGSATVEFVLVAQLLILLIFGMIDAAVLLNTKLVMMHAAREGLRRATIEGGATGQVLEQLWEQLELGSLVPERATIQVTPRHASYGTRIRVAIAYRFRPFTPLARALFGSELPLRVELMGRSGRLR